MSNKTKQRVRARMARTNETYQAALNVLRPPARSPSHAAFPWPCDVCGEELLDAPHSGMVQWLYERELLPPYRHVVALYFCHKGPCDEAIRLFARDTNLSDSWLELVSVTGDLWFEGSRQLIGDKRWSQGHEERLSTFFRAVGRARERGWRPDLEAKSTAAAVSRREAMLSHGTGVVERIVACCAPESSVLQGAMREDLAEHLNDPVLWRVQVSRMPEMQEQLAIGTYPEGSFGSWLQQLTRHSTD